jgi:DNA-binding transcriptional MerR regulator
MAEQKTTTTAKKGRPATKTKTETKPKAEVTENNYESETARLERMLAEANKAMQEMQAKMLEMQSQMNSSTPNVVVQSDSNLTRTVKVISMLASTYVLRTNADPRERGRSYVFEKFGDVQNIRFTDMVDIVNNYTSQFEKGWAILTSKKDYEDLGIGDFYNNILTKEQIENLICLSNDESVDIILDMDKETQEKIAELIAEKMNSGYAYDLNRIRELRDEGLEIEEIAELLSASNK